VSAVLLLAVNDFPPTLGGESSLYHALARHLPPDRTLVLAPRAPGDQEIDRALAVRVVRRWLPAHRGLLSRVARGLIAGWHLGAILALQRVGYLYCGQLLSLGAPTRLLAGLARVPYALFVHGADLADYHDRAVWGRLARWVVAGADAVIANSRFTAALIESLLPAAARRVLVLPMGIDPAGDVDPVAVERLRRAYGIGEGPVLLSVSRLVAMKGHDVVIQALPRLATRFPGLAYLIVGSGPHRKPLERLAREGGVAGRVVFAGPVATADLPAHYDLATLFVQLSRRTSRYDGLEGFGLSFLEAASHGVPSIAGRSGGVPEAVEDGQSGLLVPPEDAGAFAAAAERILSDPGERRRMSAAARRWAASHSWERSARFLLSLPGTNGDRRIPGGG
jgi:phosphatidylinositol alpha-1,6-mannosyltransferase